MADCQYCEAVIVKQTGRRNAQFCNKQCEKSWHKENGGNTFTAWDNDTPDVVEDRKARMQEYYKWHPLACAGDKEARRWLRHNMRLRAIWCPIKQGEVRL